MTIKILHLYYDIMNLYGEYGNIKILEYHLKDMGVEVKVDKKTIGEEINLLDYDFIYMGAGTERNLDVVYEDFKKYKNDLEEYINSDKYALFTGNSFEMLGKSIDEKETLGILDFVTNRTEDRITSDVILSSKYLENSVVGFINKMSNITNNQNPLFKVEFGIGENENNDYEGIKYKNLFCTYVSGPVLVRNPDFLRLIINGICSQKNPKYRPERVEYQNEEEGYTLVLSELMKRKNSKE